MKHTTCTLLFLITFASGCTSLPFYMSPKVATVLADAEFSRPLRDVRASTDWSRDYSHGLAVQTWTDATVEDYRRDLEPELEGAAQVLAALAASDLSLRWDYVHLTYFIAYGNMPPRHRRVVGVCQVLVRRETFEMLRAKHADAAEYRKHWLFLTGDKDLPDSERLLEWGKGAL